MARAKQDVRSIPAKDYDAWVAWLRAPSLPQCFRALADYKSGAHYGMGKPTAVCAIGGGCLAVGQEPRPSSLFYSGLPPSLYMLVTRMNDEEMLPFASIADRLEEMRERYVRHA